MTPKIVAAVMGIVLAAAPAAVAQPADRVLRNGFVYTVDARDSVRDAVAIRAGRIVYVGSDRGVRRFIGPRTRVTNLRGRMAMPGLQDAHIHELLGGANLLKCDLEFAALTVQGFKDRIAACLRETAAEEPDGWLQVESWFRQAMLPSGTEVTMADLDALSTKRPIIVTSSDHHTALANSRALQIAGITAATPDPADGRIARDAAGNPTGILEDGAARLVSAKIPPPTAAEDRQAARAALDAMRKQGITAFMSQASSAAEIAAFEKLRQAGRLTARAHFGPDVIDGTDDPAEAIRPILRLRRRYDGGRTVARPGIRVRNAAEVGQDGVAQWPAQTANLLEPYLVNAGAPDRPNWIPGTHRGPQYFPQDRLNRIAAALARAGIEPQMHAIGDRAVRIALNAYEYVRRHVRPRDFRGQISHAEMVDPGDFGRFRRLGVIPVMSFQWAKPGPDSIDALRDYLGPERFARFEPLGSLHEAGARIAYGSDWPVDPLNEWFALQVGITRKNRDDSGSYAGYRLNDEPGLPRGAALRAITMNSAYALHHDRQTGSLERGKLADLIVLDRNVLRVPADRIGDTKVLMTMVGGEIVYRAGR